MGRTGPCPPVTFYTAVNYNICPQEKEEIILSRLQYKTVISNLCITNVT